MVGARDMARVLGMAERANARVVLVGDVKQLGSVEAGRAFVRPAHPLPRCRVEISDESSHQ